MLVDKLACSVHGSKISDAGVCPKSKVDVIVLIRWFLSRFQSNQRCIEYFLEFSLLKVSRWSRMVAGTRTIGRSARNVGLKMNLCYILRTSIPPFDEVLSIFRESWTSSIIMLIILRSLLFVEAGLFLAFVDVSPKLSRLQKPKRESAMFSRWISTSCMDVIKDRVTNFCTGILQFSGKPRSRIGSL